MAETIGSGAGTIPKLTSAGVGAELSGFVGTAQSTIKNLVGAAAGAIGADGNGASTIPKVTSFGNGYIEIAGSGASTIPNFVGGGEGGMPAEGSGASTIKNLVGAAVGMIEIVGVGASTIKNFRGNNGIRYNMSITSKPIPAGAKLSDFGELFWMVGYCEFNDNLPFALDMVSDYARETSETDYSEDNEIINDDSAILQPQFRQFICAVPQEGFYGTIFHYELVKQIPSDGDFKWFGVDYRVIPTPWVDPEFLAPEIVPVE